tara:strand:- start:288 stop:524 length:237 start_codon:yes stop_codon:yes gene_type:complete
MDFFVPIMGIASALLLNHLYNIMEICSYEYEDEYDNEINDGYNYHLGKENMNNKCTENNGYDFYIDLETYEKIYEVYD